MARPLAALERFFERLVERPAARLFHVPLQPVQVQRRLERAMESARHLARGRTSVPDDYRVQIHPADLAALAGDPASDRSSVEGRLADALQARARRRGYTLAASPRVTLHANAAVARGDVVVVIEPRLPRPARPKPAGRGSPQEEAGAPQSERTESGGRSERAGPDGEATAVFAVPGPHVPSVVLFVEVPGRPPLHRSVVAGPLSIGRDPDNDLVLLDGRVSRHHGRLAIQHGRLVYDDLGSTNGSFVNDRRVRQVVLGLADELRLGSCRLTVLPPEPEPWIP